MSQIDPKPPEKCDVAKTQLHYWKCQQHAASSVVVPLSDVFLGRWRPWRKQHFLYGLIVECVSFMCYKFRTFNTSIQCWIIKIFLKDKNRKKCNSSIEENPNTDRYPVKLQIETDSSKRLFLGTQYLLFTVLFKKNFHQIYLHLKILLRRLKAKDQ